MRERLSDVDLAEPNLPDVTDRAVWDAAESSTRQDILVAAAIELDRPMPQLLAGDWARSMRDGNRSAYETKARQLKERVTVLVLAAVLTGEVAPATAPPGECPHLDAAIDGLVALAEATSWCWAPHDRFTAARGEVLPDPDEPFLDLGAADVVSLFAWADQVLGPHLDLRAPGLRRRLRREADQRVLGPFERIRDWAWIGADGTANNWNPWIHGAVLAAAVFLCDDRPRRTRLVRLVSEGLNHYLAALPDDGAIDEGIAYWWQGPCRLLEALDLLAEVGGPDVRAPFAELLRYPQRMHLGEDWYVNVGDASARLLLSQPWHVPYQWGRLLGQPETAAHAAAGARLSGRAVHPVAGLGRALAALRDPHWCRAALDGSPETPWLARESWFPRVQILVAREETGRVDGLAVAAKAGHNGEHHNHLDVGTYWVALDGRPMVVDAGRPTYTTATFGPNRYDAWPFRSAWHNVPEPGAEQVPGSRYGARAVTVDLNEPSLRAELSGAYPDGAVPRWQRTVRLSRAEGEVMVEDEWDGDPEPVLLHHLLAGSVECGDGWAVVAADGRTLRLTWDPAVAVAELHEQPLNDPLLQLSWGNVLTRLTLRVTDPAARRVEARWRR
ncbi:heparinase II/III family protein [Amycolatopsis sp. cg13]|uniref:heparinase II/III domain-containing protein n=1 Tax=Amycolatopsis sp. cg13 TaxID=3238807 RepID=UPI003525A942